VLTEWVRAAVLFGISLASTSATGLQAAQGTASYTYDTAGNTTAITGGATGNQTLTWTDQGQLATDTTAAGVSSYVYDAAGNLLIRRDPGQTTLFFGDEQLVLNTATGTITATRYYSIGGVVVAARSAGCPGRKHVYQERSGPRCGASHRTRRATRRR